MLHQFIEKFDPPKKEHDRKNLRMCYTKGTYDGRVKVTDWDSASLQYPIDNNPYDPKNYDLHQSHYNHLAEFHDDTFVTTTSLMSKNLFDVTERPLSRRFTSFYSYSDDIPIDDFKLKSYLCHDTYTTTTQDSYKNPYPQVYRPLNMPLPKWTPKRFKSLPDPPQLSDCKFFTDDFREKTCLMQKYKGGLFTSMCPWTNEYSSQEDYMRRMNKEKSSNS